LSNNPPELISVDWGTSSLRAYLADADGRALAEIAAEKGALSLHEGEHETYLASLLQDWKSRYPHLPVIASGMVGARQGWIEAPYASCPAGLAEIAAATVIAPSDALGGVRIVPGISCHDARGAPDVMRGEETQIIGALAAGGGDGVYVLPGTHSKWARVEAGRIVGFETFMTGEVYAVLRAHSVLGRMMAAEIPGEGFARGVEAARGLARPGDLLHAMFAARTFGLFETLPPDQLGEYLSGLLIGAEILAGARGAPRATAIGSAGLTARYAGAGAQLGVEISAGPADAALLGLNALRGAPSAKAV
jgi:2-dehydro-3-deoxygalactonokinase